MARSAIMGAVMPWLSLPDYARRTGTPESTVRAMIRSGKLEGHQEQRAPGDPRVVWKVWVDDPQDQPQGHPQLPAGPRMTSESDQQQASATEPPAATMRVLETLVEMTQAQGRQLLAQTETIADLSMKLGVAEAERDAAHELVAEVRAQRDDMAARLAEAAQMQARPWWRKALGLPPA